MSDEQKEMKDKDEITDLGEALVAIIQSPPGTWVDRDGDIWKWEKSTLYWGKPEEEDYVASNMEELALPIKRIRYGWVPCECEEAHQLPNGSRAFMAKDWKTPAFAEPEPNEALDGTRFRWVKWGQL